MINQVRSITKKSENISKWYNDVVEKAGLAEHSSVKGMMIYKPYGFAIWENIQKEMDRVIKEIGAQNAYFPLLIPYSFLQKEKSHIEGFSPELAVVTHAGGEDLTEPLVIRPTSETIMYDAFSRWIKSYRDLPCIINQWNNVVRWEKRPYMFLRTTEFLWQEGHSVHRSEEDARRMVRDALDMYVKFYQEYLSLMGYVGKKSESEKFAGAVETYTYEMVMPDGKVLQGCTSHNLGQNFAKAFDVKYQDEVGNNEYTWQTSWGFTTRSIGALILSHGDDNGLVLPPKVAPLQVVIIPIMKKGIDVIKVQGMCDHIYQELKSVGIRCKVDSTEETVGFKFNKYDLEGVPLRIEIGEIELSKGIVKVVRRDNKLEVDIKLGNLVADITNILEKIQEALLEKSRMSLLERTTEVKNYKEFEEIMASERGFLKAFWCGNVDCEAKIKEKTRATTRCLSFDATQENGECIICGGKAMNRWLFGLSY